MDIREWLQNTADREPPDEYHHPGFPAFLRPQPSEVIDGVRPSRHRPKRNRASSDPIDTAHQQARRKQHQAVLHSSSSEHVRLAQNKDITTSHSRDSSVSGRALAPIKSYERRARHKTRPDRYDCQPKNERKDRETYREKKRKSKRRKSHRSGDGERTVGLVQSFQLKNGPKNERLTVSKLTRALISWRAKTVFSFGPEGARVSSSTVGPLPQWRRAGLDVSREHGAFCSSVR